MRGTKLGGISLALCAWGLFATFAASGCDVFDESLIGEGGGAGTAGTGNNVAPLRFAEDISCTAPVNASFNDYHAKTDTASMGPDRRRLPACLGGEDAPGEDAFFRVEMKQGEKWHFHVEAGNGYDPAIYVMDTCNNTDTCAGQLSGINACPQNVGEHFSFIAPRQDTFVVGLDSITPGEGGMRVLAVYANCGNGIIEHSEYCDTAIGAMQAGYKADCRACRKLLPDEGDDAGSFNDGPLDSAILGLPNPIVAGRDFTFTGKLEKACDFDFFSFDLEQPTTVRFQLASADGGCAGWDVRVDEDGDPFEIDPPEGDVCPDIVVELDSGRHELRIAGGPDLEALLPSYEMTMTFGEDAGPID